MDRDKVVRAMKQVGWISLFGMDEIVSIIEYYNAEEVDPEAWRDREVVEPPKPKPLIPHLAEHKLWLAQREAGTNEAWQVSNKYGDDWMDIDAEYEPMWLPDCKYRVKPKTAKYYMAMLKYKADPPFSCVMNSREDIEGYATSMGYKIIGDIVEREVEV